MSDLTSIFYRLARLSNDLRHLFRGTIGRRIVNKIIGRKIGWRLWR